MERRPWSAWPALAVLLFGLLAFGNGISTVLECAGGLCPDNPTEYLLLKPK